MAGTFNFKLQISCKSENLDSRRFLRVPKPTVFRKIVLKNTHSEKRGLPNTELQNWLRTRSWKPSVLIGKGFCE